MDYRTKKTQEDIVINERPYSPEQTTTKVVVPGIQSLHTRSTEEIADVLSNIIRSRSNVIEIRYVLGQYVELITQD